MLIWEIYALKGIWPYTRKNFLVYGIQIPFNRRTSYAFFFQNNLVIWSDLPDKLNNVWLFYVALHFCPKNFSLSLRWLFVWPLFQCDTVTFYHDSYFIFLLSEIFIYLLQSFCVLFSGCIESKITVRTDGKSCQWLDVG